jgi:predicted transposase YdaD
MIMSNALREYMAEARAEGVRVGKAEGKVAGKAEGRAEGIAEGKAEMLLLQLTRRFGPPSSEATRRVRAASVEELDRWADTIIDAPSLDAVFNDLR